MRSGGKGRVRGRRRRLYWIARERRGSLLAKRTIERKVRRGEWFRPLPNGPLVKTLGAVFGFDPDSLKFDTDFPLSQEVEVMTREEAQRVKAVLQRGGDPARADDKAGT